MTEPSTNLDDDDGFEMALDDALSDSFDLEPPTMDVSSRAFQSFAMTLFQSLDKHAPTDNGVVCATRTPITAMVPRTEPSGDPRKAEELFVRLENIIYGPIALKQLESLFTSGMMTGYEAVTDDLIRWTPIAYHPRMSMSDAVDPDLTHEMLGSVSDLPRSSDKSGMSAAKKFLEAKKAPLSGIMRGTKRSVARRELPLPVHAELDPATISDVLSRVSGELPAASPRRSSGAPISVEATDEWPMGADGVAQESETANVTTSGDHTEPPEATAAAQPDSSSTEASNGAAEPAFESSEWDSAAKRSNMAIVFVLVGVLAMAAIVYFSVLR